jgi:hypothetical protein
MCLLTATVLLTLPHTTGCPLLPLQLLLLLLLVVLPADIQLACLAAPLLCIPNELTTTWLSPLATLPKDIRAFIQVGLRLLLAYCCSNQVATLNYCVRSFVALTGLFALTTCTHTGAGAKLLCVVKATCFA